MFSCMACDDIGEAISSEQPHLTFTHSCLLLAVNGANPSSEWLSRSDAILGRTKKVSVVPLPDSTSPTHGEFPFARAVERHLSLADGGIPTVRLQTDTRHRHQHARILAPIPFGAAVKSSHETCDDVSLSFCPWTFSPRLRPSKARFHFALSVRGESHQYISPFLCKHIL